MADVVFWSGNDIELGATYGVAGTDEYGFDHVEIRQPSDDESVLFDFTDLDGLIAALTKLREQRAQEAGDA